MRYPQTLPNPSMNSQKPSPNNRRRFFALAAGTCGAWVTSCSRQSGMRKFSQSSKALGAKVTMTAVHTDEPTANAALGAAFAELERIESVMSLYRSESQISRLNRDGLLENPDALLVEVLRFAAEVAKTAGGPAPF